MASLKAIEFEKKLLSAMSRIKTLINQHLSEDSGVKQDFLISVNDVFDVSHQEVRRLRKACAFLHQNINVKDEYIETLKNILMRTGEEIPASPPPNNTAIS